MWRPAETDESTSTGPPPLHEGTPGAAAQREYEYRRQLERERARHELPLRLVLVAGAVFFGYVAVQIASSVINHMVLGHATDVTRPPVTPGTAHGLGVICAVMAGAGASRALWRRRQSTQAWATGAQGERVVAERLAKSLSKGVSVIHDRRVLGSRSNIDHIAIGPTGIYVIDTKMVSGKVSARKTGPIWNRGPLKLLVGRWDRSGFIEGMNHQVIAVFNALRGIPEATGVPIRPMVVLVGGEWGWFARPLRIRGVWVGRPKEMLKVVSRAGPVPYDDTHRLAQVIVARLPPA